MTDFLKHSYRRTYPKNSTIIHTGENSDSLYFIIKGIVTVLLIDTDDRETIVAYLSDEQFFGEMGLFNQNMARSACIKTKTECEIAEISYDKFLELSANDPRYFIALGTQMANRLRETTRKVGDLTFVDVSGRVASALLELCKQNDAASHPLGTQIKVTRQEIGSIVGCSREMVGRVLKNLADQGLIEVKGKTMVIYHDKELYTPQQK